MILSSTGKNSICVNARRVERELGRVDKKGLAKTQIEFLQSAWGPHITENEFSAMRKGA